MFQLVTLLLNAMEVKSSFTMVIRLVLSLTSYFLFIVFMLRLRKILIFMKGLSKDKEAEYV